MSGSELKIKIINLAKLSHDVNTGGEYNKKYIDSQIKTVTILLNGGWICQSCTYINEASYSTCLMCDIPRQFSSSSSADLSAVVSSSSSSDLPAVTIVMRHGVRADIGPPEGNKKSWSDEKTGWPDRPFDPPVGNTKFMQEAVDEYKTKFAKITKIVSSPFRRCLETATFMAIKLGINTIYVNDNLGERGGAIDGTYEQLSDTELKKFINNFREFNVDVTSTYSEEIQVIHENKGNWDGKTKWEQKEKLYETGRRFRAVIKEEKKTFLEKDTNSLLIISHGDSIGSMNEVDFYIPNYCGFISINNKTNEIKAGLGVMHIKS